MVIKKEERKPAPEKIQFSWEGLEEIGKKIGVEFYAEKDGSCPLERRGIKTTLVAIPPSEEIQGVLVFPSQEAFLSPWIMKDEVYQKMYVYIRFLIAQSGPVDYLPLTAVNKIPYNVYEWLSKHAGKEISCPRVAGDALYCHAVAERLLYLEEGHELSF